MVRRVHITSTLERDRVLVTGAHGFVGSRLVAELRRRGATDIAAPRSTGTRSVGRVVTK